MHIYAHVLDTLLKFIHQALPFSYCDLNIRRETTRHCISMRMFLRLHGSSMILGGADVYSLLNTIRTKARYFQPTTPQPIIDHLIIECFDCSCLFYIEVSIWLDTEKPLFWLMTGAGEPEKIVSAAKVLLKAPPVSLMGTHLSGTETNLNLKLR